MSMVQALWDLEEAVEDAIVAHIKTLCSDVAMVIAAREVSVAEYPLVLVEAMSSDNHNDTGRFTGRRVVDVKVGIRTEALNENGEDGSIESLRTARGNHRKIKSSVIGALAGNELHTELNDEQPAGVLFSQATMTAQEREQGEGIIQTIQTMLVIAQPKESV
jgi:hypothetical protein